MARIRSLKPEFWTSEQIVECSIPARLFFVGIWTFCDDGGVIPDSAKALKMKVYPAEDYKADDIRKLIDELVTNNLIALFEVDGRGYIKVLGWHHQKIDRPSFKYPQPCGVVPKSKEHYLELCSSSDRRGLAPGVEGIGGEGKGSTENNNPSSGGEFARFAVDRFKPSPDDMAHCEAMELNDPLGLIESEFRLHHSETLSMANPATWSRLFRGWVEKRRMPDL